MRLIDADKIKYETIFHNLYADKRDIDEIPTADAEPVRHGYWIEKSYFSDGTAAFICSRCGRAEPNKEPYCNCGAKMYGKEVK